LSALLTPPWSAVCAGKITTAAIPLPERLCAAVPQTPVCARKHLNIWTWGLASVFSEFLSRSGSAFGPSFGLVLSAVGNPSSE
jgi:hypothetical protein